MLLEGLHIPLTTPFHPDGRLNPRKLAANIARYSKTPAAGLLVLGPSGEPTLLSDNETREVLRTVAEAAAPEKGLVAGIARDSVHATLDLATYAAELDYDAILVGVPSVLAPCGIAEEQPLARLRELLAFFQTIADRSPLPIVLLMSRPAPFPSRPWSSSPLTPTSSLCSPRCPARQTSIPSKSSSSTPSPPGARSPSPTPSPRSPRA